MLKYTKGVMCPECGYLIPPPDIHEDNNDSFIGEDGEYYIDLPDGERVQCPECEKWFCLVGKAYTWESEKIG